MEQGNKPRTASSPDREKYPYASAARSAENAQQIIGWNTFLTFEGNLVRPKKKKNQQNIMTDESSIDMSSVSVFSSNWKKHITPNRPCIPRP